MKYCTFSRNPVYPMVPRTTLVTQNSGRSDPSGLCLLEATSTLGFWRTGVRCIMTATTAPATNTPIQIQICGPLDASGLPLLCVAKAFASPVQRVAASKNGELQNDKNSGPLCMIGK